MVNTTTDKKDYSWVGTATSLLAVVACYGTLAVVALLPIVGISIEIDEGIMVKLVSGILILALAGMAYSCRMHRHPGPLLLSFASAALLIWVFYGSYSKPLELIGFAVLMVASVWDFRVKKRACACHKKNQQAEASKMQTPVCPTCGCSLVRLGIKTEDAVSCIYHGKEYKFCCKGCADLFPGNRDSLLAETQNLEVCPACLAEKPRRLTVQHIYNSTELYFCRCPACIVLFESNPDYYLARLAGKTEYGGVFSEEERCCAAAE